jgi:hypothetical protein
MQRSEQVDRWFVLGPQVKQLLVLSQNCPHCGEKVLQTPVMHATPAVEPKGMVEPSSATGAIAAHPHFG